MALKFSWNNIIELEHAEIKHSKKLVFNKVDFKLAEAEFVYLIGNSGSGKSSLIKCLYAAAPIKAKKAMVAGYDLTQIDKKELPFFRRQLGIVFQEFHLFPHWSIKRNLEFVLQATGWNEAPEIARRIEEVLEEVGLSQLDINEPVFELSGGQKQKIAIARSMLNKPSIIIADEPTGNLDIDSSNDILRLLHRISATDKTAILFATHDTRLMDKFPARTVLCKNHKLIELDA